MAKFSLVVLCLLVYFHGSLAQLGYFGQSSHRHYASQGECRFDRIDALEPTRRVESEAGATEYWEQNNKQLRCAGVAAVRRTIQPRGLLLPSFSNAPRLLYIVQGRGIMGAVFPGCPEMYQSFQQSETTIVEGEEYRRSNDQHQKIRHFRQGDVIAIPAGVVNWVYNDGEAPLVAVTVHDVSNDANQLDTYHRAFMLAGSQKRIPQPFEGVKERSVESSGEGILGSFDAEMIAQAIGINVELARKLQSHSDGRGEIVLIEGGFHVLSPQSIREDEREMGEHQCQKKNELEEATAVCNMKLKENIVDPVVGTGADFYNPQAGRLTSVNSNKLPILRFVQLSAERGVLYRNAMQAPHWNMNAHSIVYCTRGRGRIQIVDNTGRTVFNGEVRKGQLVVVPQYFAVVKRAESEGFEWVSFKTSAVPVIHTIAGKRSALRGMPMEVIMNSYRISREEAMRLKYGREEMLMLRPQYSSEYM